MTRSSTNIFCNSVESPLMFSLKTLDILAFNSFLCLKVMFCFKDFPPIVMQRIGAGI